MFNFSVFNSSLPTLSLLVRVLLWAVFFIFIAGLIGSFEPSLLPYVPNFCLVLVVALALCEQSPGGALTVFLIGLLVDCAGASSYLGPWAVVYLVLFLAIVALPVTLLSVSTFTIIFLCCLGSLAGDLVYELLTMEAGVAFALPWWPIVVRAVVVCVGTPVVLKLTPLFRKSNDYACAL